MGLSEFWAEAGISVLKTNGPNDLPALQQTKWRRESVLTLEMTWARGYAGDTLAMKSVDIEQHDHDNPQEVINEIFVES